MGEQRGLHSGLLPGEGARLPTTPRLGNCEGIFINPAKELVVYFVSDGKLLASFQGCGVKYLMQLDLYVRLDPSGSNWRKGSSGERLEVRPVGSPWDHSRWEVMGA